MKSFGIAIGLAAAAAAPTAAQVAPPYGYGPNQPIVRFNAYDGGTVNLRNGCVVTFTNYARRITNTRRCSVRMIEDARAIFRQAQVGGGYRPMAGNWARPQVGWWGSVVRVDFPGIGCSYTYSRSGEHLQTLGAGCTAQTRAIANDAQTAFRRSGRW